LVTTSDELRSRERKREGSPYDGKNEKRSAERALGREAIRRVD